MQHQNALLGIILYSVTIKTLLVLIANLLLSHDIEHSRDNSWKSKTSCFTARAIPNSSPESRVLPDLGKVLHNPDHDRSVFFNI